MKTNIEKDKTNKQTNISGEDNYKERKLRDEEKKWTWEEKKYEEEKLKKKKFYEKQNNH